MYLAFRRNIFPTMFTGLAPSCFGLDVCARYGANACCMKIQKKCSSIEHQLPGKPHLSYCVIWMQHHNQVPLVNRLFYPNYIVPNSNSLPLFSWFPSRNDMLWISKTSVRHADTIFQTALHAVILVISFNYRVARNTQRVATKAQTWEMPMFAMLTKVLLREEQVVRS